MLIDIIKYLCYNAFIRLRTRRCQNLPFSDPLTALERSIMTFSTTAPSPFAAVRREARERAEAEQFKNEQQTAVRAAEREAAEAANRAARKQQYLVQDVNKFVSRFLYAVAKKAGRSQWKEAAIDLVERYAMALVSHGDVELPKIDPTMAAVIHDCFAYGMFKYISEASYQNIPDDYFVGQRQDWFPGLLEKKAR